MKVKVVVFDMDDTLYDERDYVESGLLCVGDWMARQFDLSVHDCFQRLLHWLNCAGRGEVFDLTLKDFGLYRQRYVRSMLSVYRTHIPDIHLSKDAVMVLDKLLERSIPVYLVTDGNKNVQAKKVSALNLEKYIKKVMITHRYGLHRAKPSSFCFEYIAKIENVNYEDVVYIADNISKDFVNIKPLGFRTVRVKQGMFADVSRPKRYHAEVDVKRLAEVLSILETKR